MDYAGWLMDGQLCPGMSIALHVHDGFQFEVVAARQERIDVSSLLVILGGIENRLCLDLPRPKTGKLGRVGTSSGTETRPPKGSRAPGRMCISSPLDTCCVVANR